MEPPQPHHQTRSRSSRRSHPNLQLLSLAPLSSNFPIDPSAQPSSDALLDSSYIQGKSAPTTPSILSRSASSHGRSKSTRLAFAHHGSYFPQEANNPNARLTKAHSDAALLGAGSATEPARNLNRGVGPFPLTPGGARAAGKNGRHHTPAETSSDWLYRAGLAIASETRDAKGQAWLLRRESSTSLVHQPDDYDDHPSRAPTRNASHLMLSGEPFAADDEYSPVTPRHGSRAGSTWGSRVASRRGSRVGSRVELAFTPKGLTTPSAYAENEDAVAEDFIEPDFVESDEEGVGDEEEVARLARERGFGLGGWMDRLIGWSLFSVEEDGEETEEDAEEDDEEDDAAEVRRKREEELRRRKAERERVAEASAREKRDLPEPPKSVEGEGGWQDAAWLLSVASKVLL
ncbi:hypothetical protein K490DRAFT_58208 [Saccharata proteae CBS 121410]|uniref:Uncharacterized protein n=1 Tax=Saccharata proteae CBS 121410 TaxID=1314787 RepID=A0A9P4HUJ0_9PEZI|nr:hypothetical protein K490DRAFT_58208 [Saccharata proteae CBS 121410]